MQVTTHLLLNGGVPKEKHVCTVYMFVVYDVVYMCTYSERDETTKTPWQYSF